MGDLTRALTGECLHMMTGYYQALPHPDGLCVRVVVQMTLRTLLGHPTHQRLSWRPHLGIPLKMMLPPAASMVRASLAAQPTPARTAAGSATSPNARYLSTGATTKISRMDM
eukprot:gene4286-4538_t